MRSPIHRLQTHAEIRGRLYEGARHHFPDHQQPGGWDPRQTGSAAVDASFGEDLARGMLDAYALALHVLWTYQEAWSAEGFLSLAELPTSVGSLLRSIGYQPTPGTAAVGVQHLRSVAPALLPRGFRVASAGRGDETTVVYETLAPVRLDPRHNEMRAWAPALGQDSSGNGSSQGSGETSGDEAFDVPRMEPVSEALTDRLAAGTGGDLAARRAARARVEVRRLADTLRQLRDAGGDACSGVMEALCEQLCEAQKQAASAPTRPGSMSESQKLARRRLAKLAPGDVRALQRALERGEGEMDADYRARLDAMARFLEGFVSGLVQDARDQVVLLRGPRALSRLDTAGRPELPSRLGVARPGTDSLVLLPMRSGRIEFTPLSSLRTGDWLVFGEELSRVDDDGKLQQERTYHEAVRIVTTSEEEPAVGSGRVTRIVFEPPLRRLYRLDRTLVLGNIARVSEGQSVEERVSLQLDGTTAQLSEQPLTWLPEPRAPGGRTPACRVWVGNEEWTLTDNLLAASPTARVFAVESMPEGRTRLRFGDGQSGALIPVGDSIRVSYRIGIGVAGNRDAMRVDVLRDAHASVTATFNPLSMRGGTPAEDIATARTQAPAALRAMDRAVSLFDVRALALTFGGVQRATVLRGPRRGELFVTVSGFGGEPLADLRELEAFLRARVAPGVRIVVRNARLVAVYVDAVLRIEEGADAVAVMSEARIRLGVDDPLSESQPVGLLHPKRSRIDDDLRLSEVYAALEGVAGLSSCLVRRLYRRAHDFSGKPLPVAASTRVLSDVIVATSDERLRWAPPEQGRDGVLLELEQERDR